MRLLNIFGVEKHESQQKIKKYQIKIEGLDINNHGGFFTSIMDLNNDLNISQPCVTESVK